MRSGEGKANRKGILDRCRQHPMLLLAVFLLLLTAAQQLHPGIAVPADRDLLAGILIGAVVCILLSVYLGIRGLLTPVHVCIAIFAFAMILRVSYVLYTGIYTRQQDVYHFGGPLGHAGYIEYIYTHLRLPDFDPRTYWQYYHPPLHHIITAAWLRLNIFVGIPWGQAKENIQLLTLFYSGCYLIYTYRLLRLFLPAKSFVTAVSFGIVALHPTFIIMSGSINNDMLSILFLQAAFLYAILWYRKPGLSMMIKLAVAIGLGMMTKLSVGLAAPAIGFLFLFKFLREKEIRGKLVGQFAAFGAVCVPAGLWWSIRNLILFDMPVTYVPSLGETSHQYIGHYPVLTRLFDFSFYQLQSVYVAWGDPYFEHNIFIGLLKTAVFGEQIHTTADALLYRFMTVLFYSNLIVVLVSILSMVYLLFRSLRTIEQQVQRIFIGLVYVTFMASYIQFCFSFPHTCTQNIRYVTPTIWIGALAIGAAFLLVRSDPQGSFRLKRSLEREAGS